MHVHIKSESFISGCYVTTETRQIIRHRATATLRRPQKSNIQPQNGGGVTKPTGTSYNFDKV